MGTYTDPDLMYEPASREKKWAGKVNANWQIIQDAITELRAIDRPRYDIRAFGADDPTGVADSTAAFSDWADTLNAAPGRVGYVPQGTWKVSPDVLALTRDDTVIVFDGNASKIVAGGPGDAMFDIRNGGTGVQGLRILSGFVDLASQVQDAFRVDAVSGTKRKNQAIGVTVWRYLQHAWDCGLNGVSEALFIQGGELLGSPMSSSPANDQAGYRFRSSDCRAEYVDINRNRLASALLEGSSTIIGGHYFATGDVWTDGSAPTIVLIRHGGLYEIADLYGDNARQNAFIVIAPTDAPVDRVSIRGGKYTCAVQQRDLDGNLVAATYPFVLCDDSAKRVSGVSLGDGLIARASASSHFTYIVDWSAATAESSIVDDVIAQACDEFWPFAPPSLGNNLITDDTSSTTVRSSAAEGASTERSRSVWTEAFGMGLDSAPTKSTLGTVPDALSRVGLADASTLGVLATRAIPDDAKPGQPISIRLVWSTTVTESSTSVRWSVDALILAAGSQVTATGTTTAFTGDSSAKTSAHPIFEAAQQILSAVDPGDVIRVDVRRVGGDGADNFTGQANLIGFWLDYTATS